jgi:hypothetical protein
MGMGESKNRLGQGHADLRAFASRRLSLPSTVAAGMYRPDFLAAAADASPRSMKVFVLLAECGSDALNCLKGPPE